MSVLLVCSPGGSRPAKNNDTMATHETHIEMNIALADFGCWVNFLTAVVEDDENGNNDDDLFLFELCCPLSFENPFR